MNDTQLRIGVIVGSTRPGRRGEQVARWVIDQAAGRSANYDLIDLEDHPLPFYDEAKPPSAHDYQHAHSLRWAETIEPYDGFVFVSPEYNHSTTAVLKNAIDYLNREWNNKVAAIVTYGASTPGIRAAEHLRQILAEVQLATVQKQVGFSIMSDFENRTTLVPTERHATMLAQELDQLEAWAGALKHVREASARLDAPARAA